MEQGGNPPGAKPGSRYEAEAEAEAADRDAVMQTMQTSTCSCTIAYQPHQSI